MKHLLILLAAAPLSLGVAACGGSGKGTNSASHTVSNTTPTGGAASSSIEGIPIEDSHRLYDGDDGPLINYGHKASAADQRMITALVTHYYAAAAHDDGARACSLLYLPSAKTVEEDYNNVPRSMNAKTCDLVMSKLFKQNHHQGVIDHATLKVLRVRVEYYEALALVHFATWPAARQIIAEREGDTWKILELDQTLP
jgi:hypothetical protein